MLLGRVWGAQAQLVLATGQPWPHVPLALRLCWGNCGATPAHPFHGRCTDPWMGACLSLIMQHLGLQVPGCVMEMWWSMFTVCLGGS